MMKTNINLTSMEKGEIIMYQPDESIRLEVRMEGETVWLTQAQMALLFQKDRTVITRHINNIFLEKELDEESNVHFLHFAHSDKPIKYYNLDVIISVGYRVKSLRGTQFRRWANGIIKEYMLRGFAFQQRLLQTEERIDRRLREHDTKIDALSDKVDFFVRTALPPKRCIDMIIFRTFATRNPYAYEKISPLFSLPFAVAWLHDPSGADHTNHPFSEQETEAESGPRRRDYPIFHRL